MTDISFSDIDAVISPEEHLVKLRNGKQVKLTYEQINKIATEKPHPFQRGLIQERDYLNWLRNVLRSAKAEDARLEHQRLEAATRLLGSLPPELTDSVIEYIIKMGYDPNRIAPIIKKIEAEKLKQLEEERSKKIEDQKQFEERQRFEFQFQLLSPHINLPLYQKQIEEKAKTKNPSLEELKRCESWALSTDKLTDVARPVALAVLQQLIREKQANQTKDKDFGEKFTNFLHLNKKPKMQ